MFFLFACACNSLLPNPVLTIRTLHRKPNAMGKQLKTGLLWRVLLVRTAQSVSNSRTSLRLIRRNHKLRRETPREAGWDKAGEESREGCMGSYCPNRDSSPTQSQPASRKSQQMACDFCGLAPMPLALINNTAYMKSLHEILKVEIFSDNRIPFHET